jgi:hypothetical protein
MIRGWNLCALLFSSLIGPGLAQEPSDPRRIARLIRDLGAPSYQTRQSADRELARLGAATGPQLLTASASDDPEIRMRARELLRRLREDRLWQASPVRLSTTDQPISTILPVLSHQTGNQIAAGSRYEPFRDLPLSIDFQGGGYWQVLDEICRQSGNRFRPHYDAREKGIVFSAGKPGQNPIAYSGPLRAELQSARRVFDDELIYNNLERKRAHSFKLVMSVLWEDRFQLTAYRAQPSIVAAMADTGQPILPTEVHQEWSVVGPGVRQLSLELKLQPPPLAVTKLTSLLLEWGLLAVDDPADVEIDLLAPGQTACGEGVEFTVESCAAKADPLCELVLLTHYDALLPDPPESVFQENRYELLDGQDKSWPLVDQSHDLRGDVVRSRLVFRRSSADDQSTPQRLQITYPRLRSQRDLLLQFHDVPLPTSGLE